MSPKPSPPTDSLSVAPPAGVGAPSLPDNVKNALEQQSSRSARLAMQLCALREQIDRQPTMAALSATLSRITDDLQLQAHQLQSLSENNPYDPQPRILDARDLVQPYGILSFLPAFACELTVELPDRLEIPIHLVEEELEKFVRQWLTQVTAQSGQRPSIHLGISTLAPYKVPGVPAGTYVCLSLEAAVSPRYPDLSALENLLTTAFQLGAFPQAQRTDTTHTSRLYLPSFPETDYFDLSPEAL